METTKTPEPGDVVFRHFAGITSNLTVTKVEGGLIHCGPWAFDAATGWEVDDELEWGPAYGKTGSFISHWMPQESLN